MSEDDEQQVEINVEAWFTSRTEYVKTEKTISIVSYCRVCNSEIVHRTYDLVPDEHVLTAKELSDGEALRHSDADVDGRTFLQHLEVQHPEKYTDGGIAS